MLRIIGKIPHKVCIALSGGADSMAALDFINQINKVKAKRDITALYFNHGTEFGDKSQKFVEGYCKDKGIKLIVGKIEEDIPKERSTEDFWREKRYEFLQSNADSPIITCHHLDDVLETWIFTSSHGEAKTIPYKRENIIRPFLLNTKGKLIEWCERKEVPYLEDPSNKDLNYKRNYIRHKVVPVYKEINPGIYKVLRKKYGW